MTVIDLEEARTHLERYAQDCQSSPVIVTVEGKPVFELLPIRSDDPEFLERLAVANLAFRRLLEERRREAEDGKGSPLEEVRRRLEGPSR
jgi:antitoxin (DNA-binding transcriptional repressor) of toxin-antitoxin stability system